MEFTILEDTKNRFQAEIKGADHTICNVLVDELWTDKHVKVAAYNVEHPLTASPKIVIETDGADPKKALLAAADRVKKQNAEFTKLIGKAL